MIVKTEAIVLRTMKYRETSRILTLYTRQFGKVSVVAKGARDLKSKFGSALEPMSYVAAVIYKKEHRDLHLLSQCDVVKPFRQLAATMERMSAAMSVVELLDVVTHGEERNEHLFVTLVDTLQAINSATNNSVNALYFMEMKLSEIMGFRPDFLACLHCRTPLDEHSVGGSGAEVHLSLGGALCSKCSRQGLGHPTLGAGTVKVLQRLQDARSTESIMSIALTPQMRRDVGGVLRHYLQKHIENFRTLKSEGVFSAIM